MFWIYDDFTEFEQYKMFMLKDEDRYFVRLVGININGKILEPVYKSLLRIHASGGVLYIELPKRLIFTWWNRRLYIKSEKIERND